MARNISVSLDHHFAEFVDAQVQTGQYRSASDVIRAGLHLLEEHKTRICGLQSALIAGEESGPPAPFDSQAFLERMRTTHTK